MSKILTNNQYYSQIANVIREQNGTNNTYKPPQIASALKDLFYEEVEGVPPISFNGIGENLLDYRIDGASGGVGDRTGNLFDKKNTEIIHAYFSPENLWQVNEDSSSIIIKVLPNTQYTLSIATAISIFRIYKTSLENPEPGKSNVFTPIIRSSNIKTYTFTTDNDITYIIFQGTNADTEMWINSLVLNIGSTSLPSYEPYGYKVPVVVSGKNLFNKNDVIEGSLNPYDGKTIIYNNQLHTKNYIPVTANDVYIISGLDYGIRLHEYNSNHNFIKSYVVNNNNSFTVSNNCAYIRVAGSINQFLDTGMINLGSTSLPYEPYHEPTTTNIYLDKPIRTINDEIEYIDYSEQKQHRVRKNLLQNTATTQTINGVTFTVNNDKSITCNGTATGTAAITINTIFSINSTKISGCPMGGSWSSFELDLLNINTNNVDVIDTGNGAVIQNENSYRVRIRIARGYTCNNLTFYPMIRKADIEDDTYEPYIENTEVDVTLTTIPTIRGTNVLTVDTTVQPSNVYVKSRHESSYETAMRERYEEVQAQIDVLESGGE